MAHVRIRQEMLLGSSLLFCFFHLTLAQTNPTPKPALSLEERLSIATEVNALVQMHFVDPKQASSLGVSDSYQRYLQQVLTSDDRRQFDLATMEFVAQFQNGHTLFWDSWLNECCGAPLGFYAAPLDGKWVVRIGSVPGLSAGDVITAIDSQPIETFFRQHQKYISASNEAAQRRNLFLLPHLFPEQFSLIVEGGRTVAVDRATVRMHPDNVEGRWLKQGEVAYVRIPDFFSPLFEERAMMYVSQFHKARVLIIDVRNNPGGISPTRLIAALMDRPYRRWRESTPIRIGSFDYGQERAADEGANAVSEYARGYADALSGLGDLQMVRNPQSTAPGPTDYKGELIFLVDGGCVSACEDLIEPFKDNGRAMLVGETTQGSSGLPFYYDFRNGMSLKIAVKRYYMPDGSEFEGVGIKPDIEVHPSIDDLKQKRDAILQTAVNHFRQQLP
jgi:carboxyl-terminal processing protease